MAKKKTINMVKSQVIYKDYSKDAERTALVSGENLSHMFGKIARWYTDISWVGHTHTEANITDFGTYAGASTKGGAATSANKLNIGSADIGSETKPVYFSYLTGKPVACTYSLNASVPANAVFTDINVKQSPSTADESREVLFAGNTGNTETTGTVGKSNKLYFNPSTGALTATSFSGSLAASNLTGTIDAGRLPTTAVTAGSYGPAVGGTLTYGGTFDVPYVTVDKYGRLTAGSTKTFTMPAQYVHPTYTEKANGLYKITVNNLGHVSATAAVTASDLPSHTHPYIPLSGSTAITGELRVTMGETAMPTIDVSNGTYRIGIHVGSGGVNHGVYDFSTGINTWMCYHNGTEFLFNGKANTAGKWATARTLTIGSSGKSVDGSGNVSWSLSEIGAAPTSHTHQYAKSSSINGPAYSVEGALGSTTVYRHVWFSVDSDDNRRAYNDNFKFEPSRGIIKFNGWLPIDLTGQTVNLNDYNDSGENIYGYRRYICKTTGGGSNISNKAVDAPFVLEVILIRWASTTDYITKQIYHGFDKKTYQRFCTNGTWSAWTEQKYTDTVYTHPTTSGNKHIPSGGSSGQYLKWSSDGTATWSAIAAADLPSHTHPYLPLAGGTMTGAITFQVADAIKYNASSTTTNMISFITGASDGHGVRIGGGGLIVIGSGESSTALVSALSLTGNTEQTYIASDNNITFYSKCQTIGERLGIVFDNSGRLRPDTDNTRTLGGTDFYWNKAYITQVVGRGTGGSWILSRDNAIVRQSSMSTNSAYFPVISAKTKIGEWSVGTLGPSSEHFYLSYTLDTNYSAGTNTSKTYYISTDGWFNGTAAKADAWSTARTLTLTGSVTGSASIDGSGNVSLATTTNHTHSYLPLAGGTMTGILTLWGGRYDDNYALNCNNSTIIGANAIKFADLSDSAGEGIMFYRSDTTWDSVWAKNGVLYFTPNHPTDTANNVVYHSGNLSISRSLTSGTKIATITLNGTATDLYCQTNTNTDTLVTQTNTTADGQYRVVLSGTNDDTTRTETARKSVNLRFNPGTSRLFLRGTTTGDTAYGSTNPAIRFENSNASQNIELLFTDFDAIVNPASLVLIGNQGNESFLAPNIRAWDYTNNKQMASLACQTVGTTSTVGVGRVALGNSIASGTAGNAKGSVLIYSTNSYYVNLQTTTLTGSREINLPDIGGTMTGIIYKATDYYATSDHKHGLLHTNLTVTAPNNTTNTWATIGVDGTGFVLKSIRTQANAAAYMLNNYAAGIVFGGSDTRGVITHSYDAPAVRFAGGNATATEGGTAKWYFTLKATSAQTYTLPASGGTLTDIIYKASDYYATSGHTHSYLPLSGGTMTGDINFTAVSSTEYPAKSKQIYFSGSTDWAKIYYQVDASDAGRLVFDIGDDTNTRIVFANSGTAKSYIDASGNFSGNAATATTAATTASTSITIQTGSSKVSHITLETLITWLITTKGYVSKTKNNYTVLQTSWAYADNDILQVSINSTNYEIQLAGVVMEFWGCPTGYNSGLWRMRIHTPPTTSYTPASGYTNIGTSRVVEYTCNGSGYSPVWRLIEIAGHTHSYAGSSSAGGAATSANKLNTNAGGAITPVYFSGGVPVACNKFASGAYFNIVPAVGSDGVMEIGRYIDFHSTAASTADYTYRVDNSASGTMIFNSPTNNVFKLYSAGGYNQIQFQTTATDKAYTAFGIVVRPLTTSGAAMQIGCGGNMIIGAGESYAALYDNDFDTCKTVETEDLYLGADNDIHLVAGLQTYANRKEVMINTSGNIILSNSQHILQYQNSSSNYSAVIRWGTNSTEPGNYGPEIGQHNTGDTNGAICILPYHTSSNPWDAAVGLYISKTRLRYNGTDISLSGHTHSYAGSSSAGGAATSANKLNTNAGTATNPVYFTGGVPTACTYSLQRTVLPNYSVTSSNTTNYPYHLLCSMKDTTAGYKDYWAVFRVTPGYHGQYSGVYKVTVRMNNGSTSSVSVSLLSGYPYLNDVAKVVAGYNTSGTNTYLYVFLVCPTYARTTVSLLQNGSFTFYSSNEVADTTTSDKKTSVNVYASLAAAGTALVGGAFASTKTSVDVTNYANIVSTAVTDPSSSTSYGVLFAETPNTSQCNYIRKSNDFRINHFRGAANTEGWTELVLGNSTASTAANNSTGRLTMYNVKGYANQLYPNTSNTSTSAIYLPSSGGTMTDIVYKASNYYATSSHTHSYLPLSGGTLTGNLSLTEARSILLRPNNSNYTAGIGYDTSGNECIALWAKNTVTRLRWYAGTDMTTMISGTMMGITPDFEISKASGSASGYIGGDAIIIATATSVSQAINKLTTGDSDPQDNDYYIAQYAGGGTATTSYHRRKHSSLWSYINGKAYSLYASKSVTLYTGSTTITSGLQKTSVTISQHFTNYDFVIIYVKYNSSPAVYGTIIVQGYNDTWMNDTVSCDPGGANSGAASAYTSTDLVGVYYTSSNKQVTFNIRNSMIVYTIKGYKL